ncbi:MAG: SDR family oxidoreductase [Geodermatophilaceae bacterium]|nr:SDR family oxidoreductase [Geodermatophilaceae bacterium]MDQ3466049.1 SDR family oxidoreductase [Actinomycetota bacterium]
MAVAVVTGGASGIGLATADQLRTDGFDVVVLDLPATGHGDVSEGGVGAEDVSAADSDCHVIACDVTDPASVDAAVATVLGRFGRIDVLVNNAGITGSQAATVLHETPIEEWDRVHAVNVRGPFLCSRAVLPTMIEQRSGHIITIASVAGLIAFPGRAAYTASKGAALMLTKSIAVDYAIYNIRANAICPGMVYTPMTSWRLDQADLREQIERQIPLGRVAQPHEIADAVAVLASGRLGYLTGHPLVIDGGLSAQ